MKKCCQKRLMWIGGIAIVITLVALSLYLGGVGGFSTVMSGTDRGVATLLQDDKFYAYPKEGEPGTPFVAKYATRLNRADGINTFGSTCPPEAPEGSKWVLTSKGYIIGNVKVEVPIECSSTGIVFNIPPYDELRAKGMEIPEQWPGDYKVGMEASIEYKLFGSGEMPTGDVTKEKEAAAQPSKLAEWWSSFIEWLTGLFTI